MSKTAVRGTLNATINDTGLTSGTQYSYRVVARITTNAPTAGVSASFTGKFEILTP
jgi:hypothetical protein